MVIPQGSWSHQVDARQLQAVELKLCGSHLTCLNVQEQVEVVERNDGHLPSTAVLWIVRSAKVNLDWN